MIDYGNASRRALAAGATRPWWGSLAVLECRERAPLAELVGRRRAAQLGETEGDPYPLLHPAPDGTLRTWPVDRRAGRPTNNGAELIKPIEIAN